MLFKPRRLVALSSAFPLLISAQTSSVTGGSITFADGVVVDATPPVVSGHSVSHGPFTGKPLTTGALTGTGGILGTAISPKPPEPNATTYPSDGQLHVAQPAPFVPGGGLGTNGTEPVYNVRSDFDFQSLALALYVEWLELDLFHNGLNQFSASEFEAVGLTAEDRFLIEFMANQEIGHATLLTNILGPAAPKQCNYNYPFKDVTEFIDFCQKVAKFGEAGVYGFLAHLDSRPAAMLLLQAITTEARQQLIFRQMEGLFPMPVWFEVGVPQSWAWTLLAPYISSCPEGQTRLVWQNFPALWVLNQPNPARINATRGFNETLGAGTNALNSTGIPPGDLCVNGTLPGMSCHPNITNNRTIPLSSPGRQVSFAWDVPGKPVGPNNSYVTSTQAGKPAFVAWVTQLNVTYSPLTGVSGGSGGWTGHTIQPNVSTFVGDPAVNGTIFVAITDSNIFVTPFNLSLINPHVVAGPALYQAG